MQLMLKKRQWVGKIGKAAGCKWLAVVVLLLTIGSGTSLSDQAESAELHAVIFNVSLGKEGAPNIFPKFSLKEEYGIVEHKYWPPIEGMRGLLRGKGITLEEWVKKYADTGRLLDDKILEDLNKSKLLYIGQYGYHFYQGLFTNPKYAKCVKAFLERGGTILFDYYSTSSAVNIKSFLSSVGVEVPVRSSKKADYKALSIWPENRDMPLFNSPHKITESSIGKCSNSHGSWVQWSAKQTAPLRTAENPQEAIFIIQEDVLGAGRIIFNQTTTIFRKKSIFTDNVIDYILWPVHTILDSKG